MCTDLGPTIQEQKHAVIVPALISVMSDFTSPRVQAHASAAIVNFCESADSEYMSPYLDALIGKLLALLQGGKKLVQEGALTALAGVADSAQVLSVYVKLHITIGIAAMRLFFFPLFFFFPFQNEYGK